MRLWRRISPWIARIATALFGAALLIFALMNPVTGSENMDLNDDRKTRVELSAGDVMEQQVSIPRAITQFSLRADGVKEAKGLTLTVTLSQGGTAVIEREFSLAKTKAKGKLIVDLPKEAGAGEYVLRVEAAGEGSVKLGGGVDMLAKVNDTNAEMGCALRVQYVSRTWGRAAIFCGALMIILSLTPGGGREAKRHA